MPILVDCASKTSLENHANFALNFFLKKRNESCLLSECTLLWLFKVRGNHGATERQGKGEKKSFDHFFWILRSMFALTFCSKQFGCYYTLARKCISIQLNVMRNRKWKSIFFRRKYIRRPLANGNFFFNFILFLNE